MIYSEKLRDPRDLEYFMMRALLIYDFNLVLNEMATFYDLRVLECRKTLYSDIEYLLKTYLDIEPIDDFKLIDERIKSLKIFLKMEQ
jgi:hypothetical protein